jgi:hypothetical protein
MRIIGIVILFLLTALKGVVASDERFKPEWLAHPLEFVPEIERNFLYREVVEFTGKSQNFEVFLVNGYAESLIRNTDDWRPGISNRKVQSVDIVFTKYPLVREDWITNYYVLLADRLKALFTLDPALNSTSISYSLVLQTASRTAAESAQMKHGILIRYELFDPNLLSNRSQTIEKSNDTFRQDHPRKHTSEAPLAPETEEWRNETLFYESQSRGYHDRPEGYYPPKPKKRKSKVKQKCPDFKR